MNIIFWTPEETVSFEANVDSLSHLMSFLQFNKIDLYDKLLKNSYSYTVYKLETEKAYSLYPEMLQSSLKEYDVLVVAPKLEGEAIFTAIATATMSAISGLTTAAVSAAAAAGTLVSTVGLGTAIAGYSVATIAIVGTIIALGYLMQALAPNTEVTGDPSEVSGLYNGVPNITEQGGSVPVVFGNCLFGGVRIGLKFEPSKTSYSDTIEVTDFTEAMGYPSKWLKLAEVE